MNQYQSNSLYSGSDDSFNTVGRPSDTMAQGRGGEASLSTRTIPRPRPVSSMAPKSRTEPRSHTTTFLLVISPQAASITPFSTPMTIPIMEWLRTTTLHIKLKVHPSTFKACPYPPAAQDNNRSIVYSAPLQNHFNPPAVSDEAVIKQWLENTIPTTPSRSRTTTAISEARPHTWHRTTQQPASQTSPRQTRSSPRPRISSAARSPTYTASRATAKATETTRRATPLPG